MDESAIESKTRSDAPASRNAQTSASLLYEGRAARVLLVVNEDWMFWSHRLAVARAARDAGAKVMVATRVSDHGERIIAEGFRLIPLGWRRGTRNVFREFATIVSLSRIYRRERPDIAHHVGLKATLYGGIAARMARQRGVVSTITGLGFVATSKRLRARILRYLIDMTMQRVVDRAGTRMIVQNSDDRDVVLSKGWFSERRLRLIPGSGVDIDHFVPTPEPEGDVVAALVARLVASKGVRELVAAARILRDRGERVRVVLVGDPDPENPEVIDEVELCRWRDSGIVEWWSRVEDVADVWRRAHIAVLPSYREGMPRSLLEAAACGRPLVATNVPGCRDLTRDGDNGFLTPLGDVDALVTALARLASDSQLRARMGARAREIVSSEYSDDIVGRDTMAVYRELLDGR